jgi:hypothetical protein
VLGNCSIVWIGCQPEYGVAESLKTVSDGAYVDPVCTIFCEEDDCFVLGAYLFHLGQD